MTITSTEISTGVLAGNGVTDAWSFTFPVQSADQIKVYRRSAGGEFTLIAAPAYSVSLTLQGRGGGIVRYPIDGSKVLDGEGMRIDLDPDFLQQLSLRNQGPYAPDQVENALDRLSACTLWLRERILRMPLPVYGTAISSWDAPIEGYYPRAYQKLDGTWGLQWSYGTDANAAAVRELGFLSASSIGLALDGITDDSLKLNAAMAALSAAGGGTVILASRTGGALYYAHDLVIPTGINLVCSIPMRRAPGCEIVMRGGRLWRTGAGNYRLVSNATAGASTITIDTGPAGGGALSSSFAVGMLIVIEGLRDAIGKALESEENVVTAINDGTRTLTLLRPLAYAYQVTYPTGEYEAATGSVNIARVAIPRQASLSAAVAAGSAVVPVASGELTDIAVNDWVIVSDERRTASGVPTHVEIAQVIAIGEDGANTITLNRRLRRGYDNAAPNYGKVSAIDPVRRATCQGATVEDAAPAGAGIGAYFRQLYALDCVFYDAEVPNSGVHGSRDRMFMCERSYASGFIRPEGRNPLYTSGAGEGQGVNFTHSTRCFASEAAFSGCRHSVRFVGSTECGAAELESDDGRLVDVSFAGCSSVGCWATLRNLSYGTRSAGSGNVAIAFGSDEHTAGDHECWVSVGEVAPYGGANTTGVRIHPPSSDCWVLNTRFKSLRNLLTIKDVPGAGALVARNCGLKNVQVDDCSEELIDIRGNANGSTSRVVDGLTLDTLLATGLKRGLNVRQIAGLVLNRCTLEAEDPDDSRPFAAYLNDITGLRAFSTTFGRFISGAQITACPSHIFSRVDFAEQEGSTIVDDVSGNAGSQWRYCDTPGTASPATTGTGAGIAHWPLPPGGDFVTTT